MKIGPHGTYSAYARCKCRCNECREYQRARVARTRAQRLTEGRINHGTSSGYDDGCRCEDCRDAHRSRIAHSRAQRVAEGRISHGRAGYDDGCRCHKCRLAKSYVRSADFEKAKRKRAA